MTSITLDGIGYEMDQIYSMVLVWSDEGRWLISVVLNDGSIKNLEMSHENVAGFNAWIAYNRTFAARPSPGSKGPK